MKKAFAILAMILMLLIGQQCRKAYVPTGPDYADYGWTFYDAGNYQDARTWFREAVDTDSLYVDGFNGLGWSLGAMDSMSAAFTAFGEGLVIGDTTDYYPDLLAGRIFTAHALGLYDSAAVLSDVFLRLDSHWIFPHDENLTASDVVVVLAASYFSLQNYSQALTLIQRLDPTFTADVTTQAGISTLSLKIESLSQTYL